MGGQKEGITKISEYISQLISKVKGTKRGVLYNTIHAILRSDQERARKICIEFGISDNAPLEKDLKLCFSIFRINLGQDIIANIANLDRLLGKDMDIKWIIIIVTGLALVGFSYVYVSRKPQNKKEEQADQKLPDAPPPPSPPVPVALSMIVPAPVVRNLRPGDIIALSDIQILIDAASFFLCKPNVSDIEQSLELTNEDITTASEETDVYIRIDIKDGEKMIGNTTRYSLKKNVASNEQGQVGQLRCLKYTSTSGLKDFNRF